MTWRARLRQLFLEHLSSKAIVAMVVVDHMDPNLHNNDKERMTRVKEQLRHVRSSLSLPHALLFSYPSPYPNPKRSKGTRHE